MKKYIFRIAIISIVLVLGGCANQPNTSKGQYTLDESKTIASKVDGKINGVVKKYARNGQPWSVETYVDGVKNGPAKYYTFDKKLSTYNNGKAWIKKECFYKNGKREGECKHYDIGRNYVTKNKNWIRYVSATIPYSNGLINGKVKIYLLDGLYTGKIQLEQEKTVKNGKLHGPLKTWTIWRKQRKLNSVTNYQNGFKHGSDVHYGWVTWVKKYGVTLKTKYKNGIEVGPRVDYVFRGGKPQYFDKESIRSRQAAYNQRKERIRKKACAYVKNYGKTIASATPELLGEARRVCEYGWTEGDRSFFSL